MFRLFHFLLESANESNLYLLGCDDTKKALMVDAGAWDDAIEETLKREGWSLETILVTHDHYDHTDGLATFHQRFPGAAVLAATDEAGGVPARVCRKGERLRLGCLEGEALEMPGHTPDCLGWLFRAPSEAGEISDLLFVGDVLFAGSVGGTFSEANRLSEIDHIEKKIFTLPAETLVLPGHGPATTVGAERDHNPFFHVKA